VANCLLNPLVFGSQGGSPAPSWNGTRYEFIGNGDDGIQGISTIFGSHPVLAGDNCSFTLQVLTPDVSDDNAHFRMKINNGTVFDQSLGVAGNYPFTSLSLGLGDQIDIDFYTLSGGNEYLIYTGDFIVTPTGDPTVITANDDSITIPSNSSNNAVTTGVLVNGVATTPDSLVLASTPAHGTAAINGLFISYTPTIGFAGTDSFTYEGVVAGVTSTPGTINVVVIPPTNYNCDCDDDFPTVTLASLQRRLQIRLGFSAQVTPPGMADLLADFINEAQELLYRQYGVFRTIRWFTWPLVAGQRFYDINDNGDTCSKKLDPRQIRWVGISRGDDVWRPLLCGINPLNYSSKIEAIPFAYEIRQCIEIWPATADESWLLRIKGAFSPITMVAPTDVTTIDAEAIFLLALANAKAHYGQPDAAQYSSMVTGYISRLTAGTDSTQRFIPGRRDYQNAVPPKMVD
jgi:hypothetical protein